MGSILQIVKLKHGIYICVIINAGLYLNFIQGPFNREVPLKDTLKCLSIGTPKAINFPFVTNEKLMFLGVPVFKHIVMRV